MEYPQVFPRKSTVQLYTANEVQAAADAAIRHFANDKVREILAVRAVETRKFLLDNLQTVDHFGALQRGSRWWDETQCDPAKADFATVDLRGMRMRQRALAYGLAHYLGRLIEDEAIPKMRKHSKDANKLEYNFIDDVTDLAFQRIHERLVSYYLDGGEHPYKDQTRLKKAFLLKEGSGGKSLNLMYVSGALLGLWTISRTPKRTIALSLGPLAETFHFQAYVPAAKNLLKTSAVLQLPPQDPSTL